jgi:hypothetical protein
MRQGAIKDPLGEETSPLFFQKFQFHSKRCESRFRCSMHQRILFQYKILLQDGTHQIPFEMNVAIQVKLPREAVISLFSNSTSKHSLNFLLHL